MLVDGCEEDVHIVDQRDRKTASTTRLMINIVNIVSSQGAQTASSPPGHIPRMVHPPWYIGYIPTMVGSPLCASLLNKPQRKAGSMRLIPNLNLRKAGSMRLIPNLNLRRKEGYMRLIPNLSPQGERRALCASSLIKPQGEGRALCASSILNLRRKEASMRLIASLIYTLRYKPGGKPPYIHPEV